RAERSTSGSLEALNVAFHRVPKAGPPIPIVGEADRASAGQASDDAAARLPVRTWRRVRWLLFMSSAPEIVVEGGLGFYAHVVERGKHGRDHHRWPTEIVLAIFRCRVVAHSLPQDLVDEPRRSLPAVPRRRIGKRNRPAEVVVLRSQSLEFLN